MKEIGDETNELYMNWWVEWYFTVHFLVSASDNFFGLMCCVCYDAKMFFAQKKKRAHALPIFFSHQSRDSAEPQVNALSSVMCRRVRTMSGSEATGGGTFLWCSTILHITICYVQ